MEIYGQKVEKANISYYSASADSIDISDITIDDTIKTTRDLLKKFGVEDSEFLWLDENADLEDVLHQSKDYYQVIFFNSNGGVISQKIYAKRF